MEMWEPRGGAEVMIQPGEAHRSATTWRSRALTTTMFLRYVLADEALSTASGEPSTTEVTDALVERWLGILLARLHRHHGYAKTAAAAQLSDRPR